MRYFIFATVLLTWACTRPALNIGSGGECKDLDQRTCAGTAGCKVGFCSDCAGKGGGSFAGCYDPDTDHAPPCPAIACLEPCKQLGEQACATRPDCHVGYCYGCKPGEKFFSACYGPSEAPPPCPAGACLPPCSDSKDLASCDSRSDCHPVFHDPGTCLCASPGCCQQFTFCAEGSRANCKGPAACDAKEPICEGDYVVAYTNVCYEGCVRKADCL